MTNRLAASIFILLMSIATARAADEIVGPLRTQWGVTRDLVVNLVQIMPEDKYDYKPNPESRTFLAQLIHASASMYYFTDIAQDKKPRYPDDPKREDLKLNNKEQVVAFVKECVKDGADVIKAKGDSGMTKTVVFGGQTSRVSDLAYNLTEHSGEHYGQLVVYYRINSLVPPESRPKK